MNVEVNPHFLCQFFKRKKLTMSSAHAIDFSTLQSVISTQDVIAHASELHGFLTGLISAGYEFDEASYLDLLADAFNNGEKFSATLTSSLQSVYS